MEVRCTYRTGPFREVTGKTSPRFTRPYMSMVAFLGMPVPVVAMLYLAQQGQAGLGFCTLGVYVLQLLAQIKSESYFLGKGKLCSDVSLMQSNNLAHHSPLHGLIIHVLPYTTCHT